MSKESNRDISPDGLTPSPPDLRQDGGNGISLRTPLRDFRQWFGGPAVTIGPRITSFVVPSVESDSEASSELVQKQIDSEANAGIQYRTCSWQKVSILSCDFCWTISIVRRSDADVLLYICRRQHSSSLSISAWQS